jgi:glycosyltransferase involved in cell wall biosynthesis
MAPPGGGAGLSAYVLQALQAEYQVSIACMQPPAYEQLNFYFGTSLQADGFVHYQVPQWLQRLVACLPTPQALLRLNVLERFVKHLAQRHSFDVYFSTDNELSFPERGIQYVHFPRLSLPRPDVDYRWYHRLPGVLTLYRACCSRIGGATIASLRRNLTLVNSGYIASLVRALYGVEPQIVFPPVAGNFAPQPWATRHHRIVCLGRITPEKELPRVIEIVRRVRAQGLELPLLVIGPWDCSAAYVRTLRRLFEMHQDWITPRHNVGRAELVRLLAESRYGIHGMHDEHFGMAVAEMQRAGCLVFVPDYGGPQEIIGHESRLMYASIEEAVARIAAVLRDPALQAVLHQQALQRQGWFTAERFMGEIREVVHRFVYETSTVSSAPLLGGHNRVTEA